MPCLYLIRLKPYSGHRLWLVSIPVKPSGHLLWLVSTPIRPSGHILWLVNIPVGPKAGTNLWVVMSWVRQGRSAAMQWRDIAPVAVSRRSSFHSVFNAPHVISPAFHMFSFLLPLSVLEVFLSFIKLLSWLENNWLGVYLCERNLREPVIQLIHKCQGDLPVTFPSGRK